MYKIDFLQESIEQFEELLKELESQNAPIDAIELVKESIRTNKILLGNCISKEIETRGLPAPVAEAIAPEESSGLTVGDSLTTSELVELFGTEKIKDSYSKTKKLAKNPREAILKEASRQLVLEKYKEGRQLLYKIIKIYDEVKPIETNGYIEKSETVPLIQALVLHLLSNKNGTLILTSNKLAMYINMVNGNYGNMNIEASICDNEYEERFIKSEITREVKGSLERALTSMKKRHLLYYNTNLFIVPYGESERVATPEEKKIITKARKQACKELGCSNYNMVRFSGKAGLFHTIVKNKLVGWNYDYINYYFEGFEVNADVVETKHELEKALKELKQLELNTVIYNKLLDRLTEKYNLDGVGFGDKVKLRFLPPPNTSKKYLDTYVKLEN